MQNLKAMPVADYIISKIDKNTLIQKIISEVTSSLRTRGMHQTMQSIGSLRVFNHEIMVNKTPAMAKIYINKLELMGLLEFNQMHKIILKEDSLYIETNSSDKLLDGYKNIKNLSKIINIPALKNAEIIGKIICKKEHKDKKAIRYFFNHKEKTEFIDM